MKIMLKFIAQINLYNRKEIKAESQNNKALDKFSISEKS